MSGYNPAGMSANYLEMHGQNTPNAAGNSISGTATTGYCQPVNDSVCPHCGKCRHCGQPQAYPLYQSPQWSYTPNVTTWGGIPNSGVSTVGGGILSGLQQYYEDNQTVEGTAHKQ